MGNLATYLQEEFKQLCPTGWICQTEQRLLPVRFDNQMGYTSRVDVLLQRDDRQQRLWVEFEVSRADPVANHAKFSVAHLFQPQLANDTFISMVSPRIEFGRASLAAHMITLMRNLGMNAFQIPLIPYLTIDRINQLNKSTPDDIEKCAEVDVKKEIERIFAIVEPTFTTDKHKIHFASNVLEVTSNVQTWNDQIVRSEHGAVWGKRTVLYFVFDPGSQTFAPAKFCAYVVIGTHTVPSHMGMSIPVYTSIDADEKLFDGHRAHTHLTQHLHMHMVANTDIHDLMPHFERWLHIHQTHLSVHPRGPRFVVPPAWFYKKSRRKQ